MNRDDAFAMKFESKSLKIVAAGHESPFDDLVINHKDEYGRGTDILLTRNDVKLLAKCFDIEIIKEK